MKTLRNFTLNPRVAEFSSEFIPLSEIITFYTLDPVSKFQISDRPYTWSNTVFSVDGVIRFLLKEKSFTFTLNESINENKSIEMMEFAITQYYYFIYCSFLEPGTSAGKEIALGHIPNSGSGSDWRLLNGGFVLNRDKIFLHTEKTNFYNISVDF
jgi:hypothetical protein